MDRTRPSLVLMRVLLAVVSFAYGALRLFYPGPSPYFRLGPGDPGLEALPYETNPTWSKVVIVAVMLLMGYIAVRTLWDSFSDYMKDGLLDGHTAPWSVVAAMFVASFAGFYYAVVAMLATVDYRWVWPALIAAAWGVLTIYEVKQHDRYIA